MLRPVSPQESKQPMDADELFGTDGEDEGGWDEALAAANENKGEICVEGRKHDGAEDSVQVCKPCVVEESDGLWEPIQLAQQQIPLTDVNVPSRAEVARHNLTHLPFPRQCIWCRMSRTPHTPPRSLQPCSRAIPLLVFGYCFCGTPATKILLPAL